MIIIDVGSKYQSLHKLIREDAIFIPLRPELDEYDVQYNRDNESKYEG